jgi:hypothetical protein
MFPYIAVVLMSIGGNFQNIFISLTIQPKHKGEKNGEK